MTRQAKRLSNMGCNAAVRGAHFSDTLDGVVGIIVSGFALLYPTYGTQLVSPNWQSRHILLQTYFEQVNARMTRGRRPLVSCRWLESLRPQETPRYLEHLVTKVDTPDAFSSLLSLWDDM